MRQILLVANQTIGGDELAEVVRDRTAQEPSEFSLIVPATRPPRDVAARFESNFQDQGQEDAQRQLDAGLSWLRHLGATADGEVGDEDALRAVGDALREHSCDEIIISTMPSGISRWLRQDLPHRVERKFKLPVTVVTAGSTSRQ